MFGFFRTLFYTFIILVAATCFFAWHYRVATTRLILSTVLNNPVAIGDLDISLSLSKVNGKNVAIINPPKSRKAKKYALKTRILEFKTPFLNFFKKKLIIDEIYLDRVDFFVDMYNVTGSKSNIKTIIGNIQERAERRHPEGKKHKRDVIIKKIIIEDIRFFYRNPVLSAGIGEFQPVKRLEILDVGSGHPVSGGQIASIITTTLLKRFTTLSGFKHMVESLPKLPVHWFKKIFVKDENKEAVSFEKYMDLKPSPSQEALGFFKKVFSFSKKQDEEEE